MNKQILLNMTITFSIMSIATITVIKAAEREDGMRFVPDVVNQFNSLTVYPEALGFHIGDTTNPTDCRHYQGLARLEAEDGTPYFIVSKSGSTPKIWGSQTLGAIVCDNPSEVELNGNLVIFRAGSRDKNGERLRSNKLAKNKRIGSTQVPENDIATVHYTVVGGDPNANNEADRPGLVYRNGPSGQILPRAYQHPGSMQAVGNMLAVAADGPRQHSNLCDAPQGSTQFQFLQAKLEQYPNYCTFETADTRTIVLFLDVSDPENPVYKSSFIPHKEFGEELSFADAMGLTALPGGRYLLVVSGGFEGNRYHFYRSSLGGLDNPDLTWDYVGAIPSVDTGSNINQSLNFIRQGDINGRLFMAVARGHIVVDLVIEKLYTGKDRIALYEIECERNTCEPGEAINLTVIENSKKVTPFPSVGGGDVANLAAASGYYVSPTGELLMYSFNHENRGKDSTAEAGEWRHEKVTRLDSPTLSPTISLNGPFEVNEGDTVDLSGSALPPLTQAWMQPIAFTGNYPVIDFTDRDKDDYDNIENFDYFDILNFFGINGKAQSWSWYAPTGCSIQTSNSSGEVLLTVTGTGYIQSDSDLKNVLNEDGTDDIFEQINDVKFLNNCNQYYSTPVDLRWDLDVSGNYEESGNIVSYSAIYSDGPSVVNVPVQARHPTGGRTTQDTVEVTVLNVAPLIDQFVLVNDNGQVLNEEIPFLLIGQPVTAKAEFSDPGRPDNQTATLDWGDGLIETNTGFNSFSDAFGGNLGLASQDHSFSSSGLYPVIFTARDDDGDEGSDYELIRVYTAQEAVTNLVDMLDQMIANEVNADIRDDLLRAKKALTGSVINTSEDGALNMMKADRVAAKAFIRQSIFWLLKASDQGADTVVIIAILEQVIIALE